MDVRNLLQNVIDFTQELPPFIDTEKPNALIISPIADHNGAFNSTINDMFIYSIKEKYDVLHITTGDENNFYKGLNQAKWDLIVLQGHGNGTSIQLGPFPFIDSQSIDINDFELAHYFKNKIKKGGIIFVNSCSGGSEKVKEGYNIAKHIKKNGRRSCKSNRGKRTI